MKVRLFNLAAIILCGCFNSAWANQALKPLHFGVLAYRPKDVTMKQWLPLAKELEKNLPGYSVKLMALNHLEIDEIAKENKLDFILTNPEHYILLKNEIGINAVATVITLAKDRPLTKFAGVIFTRADRTDIQTLADLDHKTIASPTEASLGGYLMERWELEKNGVVAKKYIFTKMPHDNAVEEVLAKRADAGFVRSGVLEQLEKAGKIKLGKNSTLRVLATHAIPDEIPVLHSTDHYPEWPFCVAKHINTDIARRVSLTLLNLKPESEIAKAASIAGFNSPADYTPVEVLMLRLRAHPGELKYFNFSDVLWRYRNDAIIATTIAFLMLALIVSLIVINRKFKSTQMRLSESHAEISLLLNSMAGGAYGIDNQGFCRFVNDSFLKILGYENADEVVGQRIHDVIHHSYPDGTPYPATKCQIYNAYRENQSIHVSNEVFWRKDGTAVPVEYWSQPIVADGMLTGAIATFIDITERKKNEKELLSAAQYARNLIETSLDPLVTISVEGKITDVNSATEKVTGINREVLIGSDFANYFTNPEKAREGYQKAFLDGSVTDYALAIRDVSGSVTDVIYNASVYRNSDGKIAGLFAAARDVTERKKAEEEIRQLAFFDSLTGLPNRRKLLDRLNYSIQLSKREGKKFAVFVMDLDKFKAVNDSLGHSAGDNLLKQVGQRITERLRNSDMVARLGGDEFVIVLENCPLPESAVKVATQVIADLTVPFELPGGNIVQIGASIGFSFYPQHGTTPEKLIDNADTALYVAKHNGRGCCVCYENAA